MKEAEIKKVVREGYAQVANQSSNQEEACCGEKPKGLIDVNGIGEMLGYSQDEMLSVPEGANLGLGCGNPTALGEIGAGDWVLDLGSGAGFDAFLAARQCGASGHVIGVDFTAEMVEQARENAEKGGYENVEFLLGDIEDLPQEILENSIDVVISNCVINLAPNKDRVFAEAFRVLKSGGKLFCSDIVLLEELTEVQRADEELICGCVGGAILREEYVRAIEQAGFAVEILEEDREISKKQYEGLPVASLKFAATK